MSGSKDKNEQKKRLHLTLLYRGFYLLAVCIALFLGIYNMTRFASRPVDECTWEDSEQGVRIISVEKNGTAEKAGIRPGDILLQIAGENAVSGLRAQRILERQKAGEEVDYLILRGNELVQLRVRIVKAGFVTLYLIMCCIGFLFLIVGLWVAYLRPLDAKVRVLFMMFLSFMLFWTLNYIPPLSSGFRWILLILRTLSFATIPAFFLYFFLLYPTRHPFLNKHILSKILIFLPAFFIMIWLLVALVFEYSIPFLPVGIGLWGLYFILGIKRLSHSYKEAQTAKLRQQIRVLRLGITIGTIPPFLLIIPSLLNLRFPIGHYSAPLMGIIPLAFAYAVVRHRLMDIEFIIKRSFAYTLLTGLIVGFYFIVVQMAGRVLQDLSGLTGTLVLLVSTILIAVVFAPAREKIQRIVDRAFYRESYDYRVTLRQFARALNTLMEPDILIETVLTKLCESMHIRHGYFFVVDEEAGCCICIQAYSGSKHSQTVSIPVDSFFCRKLRIESKPLVMSEGPSSNHGLPSLIDKLKGVIAVPLHQQNNFLGFILLGEKQSDTPYSTEDIELLATLADQVAVAFENGRLHRALTEQERLKPELEIARQIQMNSLPQTNPSISGFDIYGCSIPATEVGGDYYDYLNLPGHRLGIVLGDVSGKGTSAALYMSKIQGIFQALSASAQSPKELLCRVNRLSYETVEDKSFMTIIAAILHIQDSCIIFVRAGHLPIFYVNHKTKRCSRWAPQGIALALDEGSLFEKSLVEEKKTLHSGDVLMMYSDGLTEAENPAGEEFGEQRLEAIFCEKSHLSAKDCSHAIIQTVTEFSEDHGQKDDMTIVIVKKI